MIFSINRGYIFHISLWLLFATVMKLFPTKLKYNRFFISFITHNGVIANKTTPIVKSSPSSFISWSLSPLQSTVHYIYVFIVHHSFLGLSLSRCGVVSLYVVWTFILLQFDYFYVLGLFRFYDVFVISKLCVVVTCPVLAL